MKRETYTMIELTIKCKKGVIITVVCVDRTHTHTTRSNINIKINTYECCSYHHLVWWKTHEAMLVCSFQVYWKVCSRPNGAAVAVAVGRERYGTKERDVDRENEKQKIVLHLCHALFNTHREDASGFLAHALSCPFSLCSHIQLHEKMIMVQW